MELPDFTVKTYRYLRLGMVVLVVMLAAAIGIERTQVDPGCWQSSISGYWFTPVRAVFAGTLLAIGVCLVVIKGNTEREDVFLNVAGMLAPVVAFVPTSVYDQCWSAAPPANRDISADIGNNMGALFVAGVVALLLVGSAVVARAFDGGLDSRHLAGVALSAALLAAGYGWFRVGRSSFEQAAHYAAAIPMFVCIVAVVATNAWSFGRRRPASRRAYVNRYLAIAVLMVGSTVVLGTVMLLTDWQHGLLWIEGALIAGFAVFWLIQTQELWHEGVRSSLASDPARRVRARP
jgi:hypothetical protein